MKEQHKDGRVVVVNVKKNTEVQLVNNNIVKKKKFTSPKENISEKPKQLPFSKFCFNMKWLAS